jgi:hypothetical protein
MAYGKKSCTLSHRVRVGLRKSFGLRLTNFGYHNNHSANSIGMTNRFFRTSNFSPSRFYGREISGKWAIITLARSVHGAICSTSWISARAAHWYWASLLARWPRWHTLLWCAPHLESHLWTSAQAKGSMKHYLLLLYYCWKKGRVVSAGGFQGWTIPIKWFPQGHVGLVARNFVHMSIGHTNRS